MLYPPGEYERRARECSGPRGHLQPRTWTLTVCGKPRSLVICVHCGRSVDA